MPMVFECYADDIDIKFLHVQTICMKAMYLELYVYILALDSTNQK